MRCILILQSVHQVMKAEKILKGNGIRVDLIPVPREISSDCGVAVSVPADSRSDVLRILRENRLEITAHYVRTPGGGFEPVGEVF